MLIRSPNAYTWPGRQRRLLFAGVTAGALVQVDIDGVQTEHRADTAGIIAIDTAQGAQIRVGVRPAADAARSATQADSAASAKCVD